MNTVNYSCTAGKIVRPVKCSRCRCIPANGRDGRSQIQAHHRDYLRPLEIEWLCVKCHFAVTRLRSGALINRASLNSDLVRAARLLNKCGFQQCDIAKFFGVSKGGIRHAIGGATWEIVQYDELHKDETLARCESALENFVRFHTGKRIFGPELSLQQTLVLASKALTKIRNSRGEK